jgi:hypothetical protein
MNMGRRKDPLEDEVPSYGLEALVSTIDDHDELVAALKAANECCLLLKRRH